MTSSRFILIFLGFIILIIVILSSSRIASTLRDKFGNLIPPSLRLAKISPSPTPILTQKTPTPSVYTKVISGGNNSSNNTFSRSRTSSPEQIPATGPEDIAWLILGGSFIAGISLKRITVKD